MKLISFPGDIWLNPDSVEALQPSVAVPGGTRVFLRDGKDLRIELEPNLVASRLNKEATHDS